MAEALPYENCCVCTREVGGAHKCKKCKKAVHVICGVGDEEEEGYGQKVICNNCLQSKYNEPVEVDDVISCSEERPKQKATTKQRNLDFFKSYPIINFRAYSISHVRNYAINLNLF